MWVHPSALFARPGDLSEPLPIRVFPFVHASATTGRESAIARYSCAANLEEGGPEVVYTLELPVKSRVSLNLQGDTDTVDVDVHILSSLAHDAEGLAPGCIDRGNEEAAADLEAGTYFVAVDSYTDESRAGPYELRADVAPFDEWYERDVAIGVRLRTKIYPALFGEAQNVSVLEVDLGANSLALRPIAGTGCTTVSELASAAGAVAAINAGFFGPNCASVSLLKIDGQLLASNAVTRTAFGLDATRRPLFARIAAGEDWPDAEQAVGGMPRIVTRGVAEVAMDEGASTSFVNDAHPRTAVGVGSDGRLLLATVDGRTAAGGGMTLRELADWMVWLGATDALNLDGGGSTTLWVTSEPYGGVVSYPSDDGVADHAGERGVSSALGVFAAALARPPAFFDFIPTSTTCVGEAAIADVAAYDLDGDALSFWIDDADFGGTVVLDDHGDGTAKVVLAPEASDLARGVATARLVVSDGTLETAMPLTLSFAGCPGVGPVDGGIADSSPLDAAPIDGVDARARDGSVPSVRRPSEEGCGCGTSRSGGAVAWLVIFTFLGRRRGST